MWGTGAKTPDRALRGKDMADREEVVSSKQINRLRCLPGWYAAIEIQREISRLANRPRPGTGTKNPVGVAAHDGVQKGSVQQSKPHAFYLPQASNATSETRA